MMILYEENYTLFPALPLILINSDGYSPYPDARDD